MEKCQDDLHEKARCDATTTLIEDRCDAAVTLISGSNIAALCTPSIVISKALAFDLTDVTERYIRTYEVTRDIAELHELECKKYLVLCTLHPEKQLGMKGPVDHYWHTFLLFTKDYAAFCREVAGYFIHHIPVTSKHSGRSDLFGATMEVYRTVFGMEPDHCAWPLVANSIASDDCVDGPGPGDCSPSKDCSGGGENCNASGD